MRFLTLRALVLLGFVVAMPVLALPPVARWMDELLYGPPPADFGRPPAGAEASPPPLPLLGEQVAPASYEEPVSPASGDELARGLDAAAPAPPPLVPPPSFSPLVAAPPPESPAPAAGASLSEATIARLQQIRQRLEELGADYVAVETVDGSGRFRFVCRMLLDGQSRFTRPFEAADADPLAAAEAVLREVETWRQGAAPPRP